MNAWIVNKFQRIFKVFESFTQTVRLIVHFVEHGFNVRMNFDVPGLIHLLQKSLFCSRQLCHSFVIYENKYINSTLKSIKFGKIMRKFQNERLFVFGKLRRNCNLLKQQKTLINQITGE